MVTSLSPVDPSMAMLSTVSSLSWIAGTFSMAAMSLLHASGVSPSHIASQAALTMRFTSASEGAAAPMGYDR